MTRVGRILKMMFWAMLLLLMFAMTATSGFQPTIGRMHNNYNVQRAVPLAMIGGGRGGDNNEEGAGLASFFGNLGRQDNDNDAPLPRSTRPIEEDPIVRGTRPVPDDDFESKFDMEQRIESLKALVVGALGGGVAATPVAYFHYIDNLAQWEFTTDMAALQAALFAIVYRYAVREDENPMLNSGVVGAFVLVRTLSNIQTSPTCEAVPLRCGEPLGYLDWDMLNQLAIQGVESIVLFGAAALAMDVAFSKGWISKFY